MHSDLPDELSSCEFFDIFSIEHPDHPMEKIMKENAIYRIVTFAAKHDLRNTKQVSYIIIDTITTFFDFILITNRRSKEKWEQLRDEAFLWADHFFEKYSSHLDTLANEAERQLPLEFRKRRGDLFKRAREFQNSWICQIYDCPRYSSTSASDLIANAINVVVKNEIFQPTLHRILSKISTQVKKDTNQPESYLNISSKNELAMTAYRSFLHTIGSFNHKNPTFFKIVFDYFGIIRMVQFFYFIAVPTYVATVLRSDSTELDRQASYRVDLHLVDVEHKLASCGKKIKENIENWLSESKKQLKLKVKGYFNIALKTIKHRNEAYLLARKYAGHFARIECRLMANLDLARLEGVKPVIDIHGELSRGGFFSIHPASWGSKQNLVAKCILDPVKYPDIAYLEAHFHRTVVDLNIEHTMPLEGLYEEDNKLFILLPRYPSSLHVYLRDHMPAMKIDKAIQILLDITRVVAHMHNHELIHRDIKAQNILIDEHEQVFLADFGTCQHGTENSTIVGSRPFSPEMAKDYSHDFTYNGSAVDVNALGVLMYVVAPKQMYECITESITQSHIDRLVDIPNSYIGLMRRCLLTEVESRPTATEIAKELEKIADQVANSKPCLLCLNRARYVRCLPCGHKTLCNVCLTDVQNRATSQPLECILCRQRIAGTMEDTDGNTYIAQ